MIRLTRAGFVNGAGDAELSALRAEFERCHCIVVPGFLERTLLTTIQERIASSAFFEKSIRLIGDEFRLELGGLTAGLEFLTNDPRLFTFVERVTGCPQIGSYLARVYRHVAERGHSSDWHNDAIEGRMATMSINLSSAPYQGGRLQIREVDTQRVVADVANTAPGGAVIFKIDSSLQHRVTATVGDAPRTAYAGWFRQQPAFAVELRQRLEAAVT